MGRWGRRWNPIVAYLFMQVSASALFSLAFNVNLVYQVMTVRLTPLELVLVGSALEATVLAFEVPTGLVADGISRRLSILVGLALTGLSFLIQGWLPAFGWIVVSQVVWGIGYTFTSGATTAWLVDEVGQVQAEPLFLRETRLSSLAAIGAIPVAVAIGSHHLALPLLISGGLFLLLALTLALRMPEAGFRPKRSTSVSVRQLMVRTLTESARLVARHPDLRLLFGVALLTGAASEGFDRLMTPHWIRDVGFPALAGLEPVAWLAGINLLGLLLAAAGARWLEHRLDRSRTNQLAMLLATLTALTAAGSLAFGLAKGFGLALVGTVGVRVCRALSVPLVQIWLNRTVPSELRATVLSMEGQMDAIGQVAGGPVIGWVGSTVSISAALLGSAGALLPAAGLYLGRRPAPDPVEA
jgi:DHA3 family tetracycline resistance protein-like MFS transporter